MHPAAAVAGAAIFVVPYDGGSTAVTVAATSAAARALALRGDPFVAVDDEIEHGLAYHPGPSAAPARVFMRRA